MRTIQVSLSDEDYARLRLANDRTSLPELAERLGAAGFVGASAPASAQRAAAEACLDAMTEVEINAEICAVRAAARRNF